MKYDFNYIIDPITWDDFINNYFEKKPLLIKRGKPNYYSHILTVDNINNHLNQADLIYPGVRLVKNANEVNPKDYTYTVSTTPTKATEGIVDKEKMFANFYDGNTIILNSHERHSKDLLHLRHVIEKTFCLKAQTNIYLTPSKSQGFTAHWDTHDVFVIQVGGSKEWKLYDSPTKLPSKKEIFKGIWERTEPQFTTILEEGDILYIPRGFVHEANSNNDISLHITLGLKAYSNADLLRIMIEDIDDELFFRESLPIGFDVDKQAFIDNVKNYFSKIDLQKGIEKMHDFFLSNRLVDSTDRLNDYLKLKSLALTSTLQKKLSVFYEVKTDETHVILCFNNKELKFPIFIKDSLTYILNTETFEIKEILGQIDDSSKLVFCKKLIEEGFLTISNL